MGQPVGDKLRENSRGEILLISKWKRMIKILSNEMDNTRHQLLLIV